MALTNKLINKRKYDPAQIQKLADLVRIHYERGNPFDYEIMVDDLKVVRRTSDPELFFIFEDFVTAETKGIEVIFYRGSSNVPEKRIFTFIDDPAPDQALSGVEIDARIQSQVQEQVNQKQREWEYNDLLKRNAALAEEVKDLEKEVHDLEQENEQLKSDKSPLQGLLGELGSSFVVSFLRKNPKILNALPGGEALSGLLEDEGKQKEIAGTIQQPDAEVSFTPRSGQPHSEEEQAAILFVNQLKTQFTKDEFDKLMIILQSLADDKSKIDLIIHHVNLKRAAP